MRDFAVISCFKIVELSVSFDGDTLSRAQEDRELIPILLQVL